MFKVEGLPLRISPSGPFVSDSVSKLPLKIGPGSLGIVLRAQGTSGTAVSITNSPVLVPGLEDVPCILEGGRHYDIAVDVAVYGDADPTALDSVSAVVEFSEDGGSVWLPMPAGSRLKHPWYCGAGSLVRFHEIDWNRVAAPANADVTNLRVSLVGSDGGKLSYFPGLTTLRVEQYVA